MLRSLIAVSALVSGLHCASSGAGGSGDGGVDDDIVSIAVEPAAPTVTVSQGSAPELEFRLRATLTDGSTLVIGNVSWSLDAFRLGAIGATDGRFVASGAAAGTANVTARLGDRDASTTITVRIEDEYVGPDVPPGYADKFDNPGPGAGAANVLYPLDGVVMPSSVAPVHVQWDGGEYGDIYRVTVESGLATVVSYVFHSGVNFTYDWPIAAESWTRLVNSAGDQPMRLLLDRYSFADDTAYRSIDIQMTVVEANLDGAIYYWDLARGKMLRITGDGREDFMPTPPASPTTGSRCVACHTVSNDGRYLAAELWGGNEPGAVFDLTQDLSGDPAPTVVAPGAYSALFSTFSPDSTQLLVNIATRFELRDARTGAIVPTTGLPQTGAAHPAWSPDGTLIAYAGNIDGTWAVDYTVSDLSILPVSGTSFGPPTVVRAADGLANSWPSFSPDSQWIAYGRGANSRARRDDIGQTYPGSLWMVSRDGGASIELANATGGRNDSYLPNFSPFDTGGYYWVAFYTTAPYGNAQVGTRGTSRRQLWVTAVSNDPQAGVDPSHVPFWLPYQDTASNNMSAYWAPRPPVD